MDAFNYLSVLLSIVIGLGLTQLLAALGRLIRARARVRFDWLPLVAACVLFVIFVQFWWASFGLRDRRAWTFVGFFAVLLQAVLLYMSAALVLPETVDEPSDDDAAGRVTAGVADLRRHYERQAPWLFGFLTATVLASLLKDFVLEGQLPESRNLAFHGFLLVVFAVAASTRRRRVHEVLGVVNAGAIVVYIATLFSDLR